MPRFNVTAPDGTIIPVDAPDGATEQQAIAFAASTWKPAARPAEQAPASAATPERTLGLGDILSMPFEMGANLAKKPRAEQAAVIAPAVEALGAGGGATIGSMGGPAGTVAGAGVGYATAKELMRYLSGEAKPETLQQAAVRQGQNALEGSTMEAGGRVVANTLGDVIKYVGPKLSKAASGVADVLMPSRLKVTGLADALENNPEMMARVKALLDQGKTVDEAAAITGSTGLAAYAQRAKSANNTTQRMYNELDAALKESQANKLAAASQNLNALNQKNIPVATASPTAPRRAVKQSLAAEAAALKGKQAAMTSQLTAEQQAAEAALAAERQAVEGGISNVSQLETGQALAEANKKILENTQKTVTGPAYQKAFEAAPDATIDLTNVAGVAKEQRAELLTQLKGLAPNSAALLERYGPKEVESVIQGVPVKQTVMPAPITLAEAHAIRQAINIDRAALKGSNEAGANITRSRLNELYDSVNKAIERDVSQEAQALFKNANDLFKERIVGVHRTGQPSNLTRTSTLNEPMLKPGDIVSKAMADEGSTLQFLKIFKQDPEAMQTLKTGVEDLYRQQVMAGGKAATPEAHAKFMFDNAKQLGALDSAGMNMSGRLSEIGAQVKGVTEAEKAIAAQGKTIPSKVTEAFKAEDEALNLASSTLGFKQTDKLRSAVVKDADVASQALARMDTPAKSSLARGVMQDVGKASDPLKHLVENEQGIMRVLKAHDPKTAKATFEEAKNIAELTKIVEETGNKLGVKAPVNAMATQQNLNKLTQGLPEVRAAVEEVQAQIQNAETFKRLATQGEANVSKLFSAETKPHMFPLNKVWAIANAVLTRLEGRIDKKLAVEIATELANSSATAAAIAKAQAKQASVGTTSKALAEGVKKAPAFGVSQSVNALIED